MQAIECAKGDQRIGRIGKAVRLVHRGKQIAQPSEVLGRDGRQQHEVRLRCHASGETTIRIPASRGWADRRIGCATAYEGEPLNRG
jgi:hypothetical protein